MSSYVPVEIILWEDFANAIIIQAANDYRRAKKKLHKNPNSVLASYEIKEIEQFFHSEWYSILTRVDGDYILDRLQAEPPGYVPPRGKPDRKRRQR